MDHFLGRDRPLGQSRKLHEIGRNGADPRGLRATLLPGALSAAQQLRNWADALTSALSS